MFSAAENLRFQHLQRALQSMNWQSSDLFDQDDYDILVVPSLSIDQQELKKVPGVVHYEERLLFSLIHLRNPRTRVIYVTDQPLSPLITDYYLQLLAGVPFHHASDRLLLLSAYDSSLQPLTAKILQRPRLIGRIKQAMRPDRCYMVCYNSTALEKQLALALDIPLLACDPDLFYWGFKSGSKEIFKAAGVPTPAGSGNLTSVPALVEAIAELWQGRPQLQKMVIKLNEGFSGEGNAIFELGPIQGYGPPFQDYGATLQAITAALQGDQLRFQSEGERWSKFSDRIPEIGAIVEEFIGGEEVRSPSFQGYITPRGEVKILSTHDQILGGPDQQIYLGCSFPADQGYRLQIQALGVKIGQVLAQKNAIERYGVDFMAVKQGDDWELTAIEINLRKGGTTHPFMILKLLTNGNYDEQTGLFHGQDHQEKYYFATDNLHKNTYQGLLPQDLMDILVGHRLHFQASEQKGSIFHLVGSLSEFGKVGLTSIGNSFTEAQSIYHHVEAVLDQECHRTNHRGVLPLTW